MANTEPRRGQINSSPLSSESTSLSSSFVSSAASDMLPADSSQSDIDHSAGLQRPPAHWPAFSSSSSSSPSPPVAMGQTFSKPYSVTDPPKPTHKSPFSAAVAGVKLKRAFAARRKRSEDTSNSTSNASLPRKLDHRSTLSASAAVSGPGQSAPEVTPPRQQKGPKLTLQMATQVLTGGKKSARTPLSPLPPPLPPKPPNMQGAKLLPPLTVPPPTVDNRSSIIALSPGISSAVNFMRSQPEDIKEEQDRKNPTAGARKENELVSHEPADKRKSDSTISHHTIRPGATGTRTPRPVSMAESLQTICAPNRRSTLLEDGVPEENESFHSVQEEPLALSRTASPTTSLHRKNRRHSGSPAKPQSPPPIVTDLKQTFKSLPDGHPTVPSVVRETPTLTRAAANGIISPSSAGLQSTGNNIRGRLAAWTATNSQRSQGHPPKSPAANFRQTALNVSNGLAAPAAGLAKRAVEKMGRWGGFSSSSSTSGYSSSSSSTAPSSYDHALARTASNQSSNRKYRRTPDAPSGAWSVNSSVGSSSISDSEAILPSSGPILGIMVRAPLMLKAPGAVGMVFGRDLKSVVKMTGIGMGTYIGDVRNDGLQKALFEERRLPAIVARCAQHILIWGIQEEGLFRVSGRPAHVSKVRNEFDTGADFDMRECSPGELDPHAVASVFKAFLRELPEPILTRSLLPLFDEALSRESSLHSLDNATSNPSPVKIGGKGPGLPSGPKGGFAAALRKPPSLSTLAMPSLQGMPPPSKPFLNALRSLVTQLPPENRDLIRTVADLITATAKHQKQTKMPLSNLLLVFCPSLNMNPPLLRVLCEADSIWEASAEFPDPDTVLDIKRDSVILDISASTSPAESELSPSQASDDDDEEEEEEFSDAQPSQEEPGEVAITTAPRTGGQETEVVRELSPVSPAESCRSDGSRKRIGSRPMGPRRQAVPATIFPDGEALVAPEPDATSDSSHEAVIFTSPSSNMGALLPPPLSSSAESLSTPPSSSAEPSFEHLPVEEDEFGKLRTSAGSPTIANASERSLPVTPHRPHISVPIQFPTSGSAPDTPLSSRRSIPLLSLPSLGLKSESSTSSAKSAPASPRIRLKRPSMTLFSKRSASGLNVSIRPIISAPCIHHTDSESSTSTPQSAVTAPQSSTYIIDTPVDSSPLKLGLGLDAEHSPPPPDDSLPPSATETKESVSSTYQLGTTPIADRFRSDSTLSLASPTAVHLREKPARQASQTSNSSSSSRIDLLSDEEAPEEWTKSVLLAADRDWT